MRAGEEAEFGSDHIVALLERFGIEIIAFNPGASFRGIHDSTVHRGQIQVVLATQEMLAVAIAHGYAKAARRPMAVALHNIVGLQQAAMAIYNGWCDRVPILLLGGTGPLSIPDRRPWIDWIHTTHSQGEQVRHYVKWDDQPIDLASVSESFVKGWTTMLASPPGPVYLCYDTGLQEMALDSCPVTPVVPDPGAVPVPEEPAPGGAAVQELVERLLAADLPVIVTDFAGETVEGFELLVSLAERLEVPVIDCGARQSFPAEHRLAFSMQPSILAEADAVIAIDVDDLYGALRDAVVLDAGGVLRLRDGCWVAQVTPKHFRLRAWGGDGQRQVPCDLVAAGSALATLRALTAALGGAPPVSGEVLDRRRAVTADRVAGQRRAWRASAARASAVGAVPRPRLAHTLGEVLEDFEAKGGVWVLGHGSLDGWERRLWPLNGPSQRFGTFGGGGGGLGFGVGASIGTSLALGRGTLVVNLQADGDFLFTPAGLWTLANLGLPVVTVLVNNRQYGNTAGHALELAGHRRREPANYTVGTSLDDPPVDYTTLARSMGVWAEGPIGDPDDLRAVLDKAVAVALDGRPALVEVLTPGVAP